MGEIQKQGIINSVLSYIGFFFGFVNVIVLYPIVFSKEQFGLTRLYNDLGGTFAVFASFGVTSIIPRFLPYYQKDKAKDLIPLTLMISMAGSLLLVATVVIFREQIFANYCSENPLFREYAYLVVLMGVFSVTFSMLSTYSNCNHHSNISFLIAQLFNRAYPTLLLVCVFFKWFGFPLFIHLMAASSILQVLMITVSLYKNNLIDFSFKISPTTKMLKRSMAVFAASIFVMISIEALSGNIQVFTISDMKGIETTAIFVVASYISQMIQMPQRSIAAIAIPVVSTAWYNEDYTKIQSIYRKSSVNMNIAGLFLFLVICLNIENIFTLIGKGYSSGIDIAIFMGIAYLLDVSFGINNEIINTSKYWRLNFITHMLLLCIMIPTNYFLIKHFGAIGSAYALMISLGTYNTMRMLFLYFKFQMNPFTWQSFFLTAYVLSIIFIFRNYIDRYYHLSRVELLVFMIFKGAIGTLLFFVPVIYFRISEEVNGLWDRVRLFVIRQ